MAIYLRYDPNIKSKSNIQGLHKTQPEGHWITITEQQENSIVRYPMSYTVADGKLIQLEDVSSIPRQVFDQKQRYLKQKEVRVKIESPLEFNGAIYNMKTELIQEINLNLNICSIDKSHTTKLFCLVEGRQEFKVHNREQLLGLAKAYDSRRIDLSENL